VEGPEDFRKWAREQPKKTEEVVVSVLRNRRKELDKSR
jgi:hypothetical protein